MIIYLFTSLTEVFSAIIRDFLLSSKGNVKNIITVKLTSFKRTPSQVDTLHEADTKPGPETNV